MAIDNLKQSSLDSKLINAATRGALAGLSKLLAQGANPFSDGSKALCRAAEAGHVECVRVLIPASDPKSADSAALRLASRRGHVECVMLLIPASNPKSAESDALRWASYNGHAECVELLIPVSDPLANDSQALIFAINNGHAECVRLLTPVSKPKAKNSWALRLAGRNGDAECFRLLLPASAPLLYMRELLDDIIDAGDARILAIMLAHEPRLLKKLNRPNVLSAATANGHLEMAALISSVVEQKALASSSPPLSASLPRPSRRL